MCRRRRRILEPVALTGLRRGLPCWVAVCALAAVNASAQTALQGRAIDARGAGLAGVTVTAASPALAAPVIVTTDTAGAYRFPALTPGSYTLDFRLVGFQPVHRENIQVRPAAALTVDVQLELAPLTERVDVVALTPTLGATIRRDLLPATVTVLGAAELDARRPSSMADALNERFGAISLEGATANLLQPTLRFRGFTASPLLGLPQGIAVYQNGVRINEPFGDTVQFDLMPMFAVDQVQLSAGADPTYGLNALGGAVALRLKNGFDAAGFHGEFSGGSFGRFVGTAEYGAQRGPWALYVGATKFDETGWRQQSPSHFTQAAADIAYRRGKVDAGINVVYADSTLNGNGPAPIELLAVDRTAVFTYPDITGNELAFVQSRLNLVATDTWSVQVIGYYRDADRRTLNGDEAEFGVCGNAALPDGAPGDTLCQQTDADDEEDADDGEGADGADPLVDARTGRFITEADALGDAAFNRTSTSTQGYGAAVQATAADTLGGRDHVLALGLSADLADIAFASDSEVGTLTTDRTVSGSGLFAGIFGQAPDDIFNTSITTENRAVGLYFSDTVSVTDRTHVTLSGRFNHARIDIFDNLGASLNGNHAFSRFNPGLGVVFEASGAASVFARYTESNRAPTAAELSCADPAEPCRVPNAFISDPPLEQAVAKSLEGGIRGDRTIENGNIGWSASVFQTRIDDDILFVASQTLIGTGFFQNAGDTRRVGIDMDIRGRLGRVSWFSSYGLVEATFESALTLPGNNEANDAANDDGELEVEPGDRLAGIPRHSFKAGIDVAVTRAWNVSLETIVSSSRIFLGDEGNHQRPLDGYRVANLRSSYRIHDDLELFVRIDNLFDTRYETFGALAELELELDEVPNASDPRFVGPGAPRSGFAGVRTTF